VVLVKSGTTNAKVSVQVQSLAGPPNIRRTVRQRTRRTTHSSPRCCSTRTRTHRW
jgi:hypothetical protein